MFPISVFHSTPRGSRPYRRALMTGGTFLHFINNRFVPGSGERQFEKRSPIDGSLVGMVAHGGQSEVDAAVQAARAALRGPWGRLEPAQRAELLHAVAKEIERRFEDFL